MSLFERGAVNPLSTTTHEAVDTLLKQAGQFHQERRLDEAEAVYRKILTREEHPLALINLGHLLHFTGRITDRRARTRCPGDASLLRDLGASLLFVGERREGLDLMKRASELLEDPAVGSALLLALHYDESLHADSLHQAHRQWARRFAPDAQVSYEFQNDRTPDRRLRIGYLSGDFRTHPVAFFFESLLDGHNRQRVEIVGYSQVPCADSTAARLRAKCDRFRPVDQLDDEQLVAAIRADRIDILVDLAGHTPGNRLCAMAKRPAPIQVTYCGYPDTTGMGQIDYRLVDALSTPASLQPFYSEELVTLPESFLCYRPSDLMPAVTDLPLHRRGHITFGVFNDTLKVNQGMITLWSDILRANPASVLVIKFRAGDDPGMCERIGQAFADRGIDGGRIDIQRQRPIEDYYRLLSDVDIALDTFPYNGTATTCDALWMGVPVISLKGTHHASRVGLSLLSQVGLGFFAADDGAQYVAKATALAQQTQSLARIRSTLRQRMQASTLCRPHVFAGQVEAAYLRMWKGWVDRC
jgi:protein O-GlcNAc transferase